MPGADCRTLVELNAGKVRVMLPTLGASEKGRVGTRLVCEAILMIIALDRQQSVTPDEVATRLGLPASIVYAFLDHMTDDHLVNAVAGRYEVPR